MIVIVCRDGGERHAYRRKTKLHPIVFDCDAYCDKRRLADNGRGRLPDIPIEKIDWDARDEMKENLEFEIDKLSVVYEKEAELHWENIVNSQ
jgi:hypothetical protein